MLTPIRRVKRRDPIQVEEPSTPSKRIKREAEPEVGMLTPPSTQSKRLGSEVTTGYSVARALFERGSRTRSFIGREKELAVIEEFISKSLQQSAGALYISGVPGTGKSAMVTKVLDNHLEKNFEKHLKIATMNCITVDSVDFVYSAILAAYGYSSFPSSKQKALEALNGHFKDSKLKHLLMLDEIDHFMRGNQQVLFQLFEWSCQKDSNLVLVGIANTLDLTDKFLPRLQAHQLVPEALAVKPYEKADILRILEGQLHGLPHQIFSKQALELFSAKVASQTGDLRRAFDLCSRSLHHAEQDWLRSDQTGDLPPVSIEHALMVCQESFGGDSIVSRIKGLNYIQQCVLVTLLILEHIIRNDRNRKVYSCIDVAQKYAFYASQEPSWTMLDIHEVFQVLTALESQSLVKVTGVCGKRGLGKSLRTGARGSRGGGGACNIYHENAALYSSRRVQSRVQMMDAFSAFTHDVLKRILCECLD